MPILDNQRHELFCQGIASGLAGRQAYIQAGYTAATGDIADAAASRLLRNVRVSVRVDELKAEINERSTQYAISNRNYRVGLLQETADKLKQIFSERAAHPDFQAVPGGKTGLFTKSQKNLYDSRGPTLVDEFSLDAPALRELRETMKQASIELGQWQEKPQEAKSEKPTSVEARWVESGVKTNEQEIPPEVSEMMKIAGKNLQ